MWLSDPASEIIPANGAWAFFGVLLLVLGSLGGIYLRAKLAKPDAVVAPVAAQTTRQALEEQRAMIQESFLEPLQAELEDERRARIAAERAQAQSEREALASRADLAQCNDRLQRMLLTLAEERRVQPRPRADPDVHDDH